VAIGALIRDLRQSKRLTQLQLSEALNRAAGREDAPAARDVVARWESGRVIPGRFWLTHLAEVLDVPSGVLEAEARVSRVDRRAFLSLTALAATHGKLASEMVSSLAARDPGPLATMQTTHATDLLIASKVEPSSARSLERWMTDGSDAVLRVNAAGILAKLPGQAAASKVARTLTHDAETRQLYMTAVVSRVCAVEWSEAAQVVADPLARPARAPFLAARLATETLNPRDAGARWCSAEMLRDLSPLLGWESPCT
jgi:transcriptional regulator with XRE-family HTH domain